jgi:hypothetical protein
MFGFKGGCRCLKRNNLEGKNLNLSWKGHLDGGVVLVAKNEGDLLKGDHVT